MDILETENLFLDTFSNGLDELPKRKQRSSRYVLEHLALAKGFSVFEVTENETIAGTVDRVIRLGYLETTPKRYPWTDTKLTQKGIEFLQAGSRALPEQALDSPTA